MPSPVVSKPSAKQQARWARQKAKQRFIRARKAEKGFARALTQVAKQVGVIVNGLAPQGFVKDLTQITSALRKYSELLLPWAGSVAGRMVEEVAQRDMLAWHQAGREVGADLKREVTSAPTGGVMQHLLRRQVQLITSLPLDAAQRVHEITTKALYTGARAHETAKEIAKTSKVTESRAMLIARTETSRTVTSMTEARARHIGSEGYIWRTAEDADVRLEHRKLDGKFVYWNDPPVAGSNGERAHAGSIYNCRCYAEPVLPERV